MGEKGTINFNKWLKKARKGRYSNREHASSVTGIPQRTLGEYERGEKTPPANDVVTCSRAFKSCGLLISYCDECPVNIELGGNVISLEDYKKHMQDVEVKDAVCRVLEEALRLVSEGDAI